MCSRSTSEEREITEICVAGNKEDVLARENSRSQNRDGKVHSGPKQSSFWQYLGGRKDSSREYPRASEYAIKNLEARLSYLICSFIGKGNHWRKKGLLVACLFLMGIGPVSKKCWNKAQM